MRSYAAFFPKFWLHGAGKKLRGNPDAITLVAYLFTSPSSNSIGLFYEPIPMIVHNTGVDAERILALLQLPAVAEVVRYDAEAELVWLPEHAKEQLGERLKPNDKRCDGVRRELALVADHPFVAEFRARYSSAFSLESKPLPAAADAPSKGLPASQKPPYPSPSPLLDPDPSPNPDAGAREPAPPMPVVAPVHVVVSTESPPTSIEAALQVPLKQRASHVTARKDLAEWVQPQNWPEVGAVADAFSAVSGRPVRLGGYQADRGLQRVIELFAAGYSQADVIAAVNVLPSQAIWQDPSRRTLGMLSLEVVRRTEGTQPGQPGDNGDPGQVDRILSDIGYKPPVRAVG